MQKCLLAASLALALSSTSPVRSDAPATVKVAAIQYAGDGAKGVDPSCADDDNDCAIEALVRRAKDRGAALVVTPEHAFDQVEPEPPPAPGKLPDDPLDRPLTTRFSALAHELGVYLVIDLETKDDEGRHNTQVAFDPSGVVVAVHDKFELYESERRFLVPGRDVTTFDTPFGKVGLLVCADLYGDPRLHDQLTGELGARIIAFSTKWTVARATRWQAAFARDWSVYLVASNGSGGMGKGGGVFDPKGDALAIVETGKATVSLATIPLQKR